MALINFVSKINIMTLAFIIKLGFFIWLTNIGIRKIDNSVFKIYDIVIIKFSI